jgi:hypothetical protein
MHSVRQMRPLFGHISATPWWCAISLLAETYKVASSALIQLPLAYLSTP